MVAKGLLIRFGTIAFRALFFNPARNNFFVALKQQHLLTDPCIAVTVPAEASSYCPIPDRAWGWRAADRQSMAHKDRVLSIAGYRGTLELVLRRLMTSIALWVMDCRSMWAYRIVVLMSECPSNSFTS